jgi:hypothetical protein
MSQETKKVRRKVCKKPYSLRNNGTAGGYFLENYWDKKHVFDTCQ